MEGKPRNPISDGAAVTRDEKGRILPGSRGLNPDGRHGDPQRRATVMKELYRHGPEVVEMLMEWARKGDKKIALFMADKIFPNPAPIEVREDEEPREDAVRTWTVAELRAAQGKMQ